MLKPLLLVLLWIYQRGISPALRVYLGSRCRFSPTCSQYMVEAIQKYGTVKGLTLGMKRLLKCHPWHPGGVDLP